MQRRSLLRGAAAAAAAACAAPSFAQPGGRTVTLVVPYAAGGNADLTARLFAEALGAKLGQPAIVENRAGAGGSIGALHIIGSRPDGNTLLFSAPSVFSVIPHLVKVSYSVGSVRPVCLVSKTPLVLVVKKGSKYKSLAQLAQAAKAANGMIPMGYSGLGTPNHLAMLNLETVMGTRFNGVAYKGSGPMLQDMLGGQIDLAADQISTSRPYIESGDLVPIAVFGAPLDNLPGVPSVSTLGKEPFDVTTYLGIAAPPSTPDAIVAKLQTAAAAATQDARFAAGMAKMGSTVFAGTGDDYSRFMRAEDAFMKQMLASGRVKPE